MQRFRISQSIENCLYLLTPKWSISNVWGTSRKRTLKHVKAREWTEEFLNSLLVDILTVVTWNQYYFICISLVTKDVEY